MTSFAPAPIQQIPTPPQGPPWEPSKQSACSETCRFNRLKWEKHMAKSNITIAIAHRTEVVSLVFS